MPCKSTKDESLKLIVSSRVLNLLTSYMPQHEGLYLATVQDGAKGEVHLSFDPQSIEDIQTMIDWYQSHFPNELTRL